MNNRSESISDFQSYTFQWSRYRRLIILSGWSLFGLYMAVQQYYLAARFGQGIPFIRAFVAEMTYAYLWAALTPLVLSLGRRFRIERSRWWSMISLHIVGGIAIAIVQGAGYGIIFGSYRLVFEGSPLSWEGQLRNLLTYLDYGILLYWMILILDYAFDFYHKYQEKATRAAELQAQLAQSQLQSLKMQLHPHFLFNTLNAISVLIQKKPEVARHTIGRLSDLLRLTLEYSARQVIPLRLELEFLDRYLKIEQTRFEDRLTVQTNIDAETLDAQVPNLILQPLVENSIKHGVNGQRGPAVIRISAKRLNGDLRLEVSDNGKGLDWDVSLNNGIGLSNMRARLRQLYGDNYQLELSNGLNGGAVAAVKIPFSVEASR